MASEIKVDKISPYSGNAISLASSGQKIQIPAGATITNSGTATNFGGGKIVKVSSVKMTATGGFTASAGSFNELTGLQLTHTAASTNNRLLFMCNLTGTADGTSWHVKFYNNTTGANPTNAVHPGEGSRPGCTTKHCQNNASWATTVPMFTYVTPPNTSANQYTVLIASHNAQGYYNRNYSFSNSGNADSTCTQTTFTIMEIDSGAV